MNKKVKIGAWLLTAACVVLGFIIGIEITGLIIQTIEQGWTMEHTLNATISTLIVAGISFLVWGALNE